MDEEAVLDILKEGAERAKGKADEKLLAVKRLIGVI
jgi:hypothetical protein